MKGRTENGNINMRERSLFFIGTWNSIVSSPKQDPLDSYLRHRPLGPTVLRHLRFALSITSLLFGF